TADLLLTMETLCLLSYRGVLRARTSRGTEGQTYTVRDRMRQSAGVRQRALRGRCWIRTNEGIADGFTDRSLWPLGQPARHRHHRGAVRTLASRRGCDQSGSQPQPRCRTAEPDTVGAMAAQSSFDVVSKVDRQEV